MRGAKQSSPTTAAERSTTVTSAKGVHPLVLAYRALGKYAPHYLGSLLCEFAGYLSFGVGLAWAIRLFTEAIMVYSSQKVVIAVWVLVADAAVMTVSAALGIYLNFVSTEKVAQDLRVRIVRRTLGAPVSHFDGHPIADTLTNLLNDVEAAKDVLGELLEILGQAFLAVSSTVALLAWGWQAALVMLGTACGCAALGLAFVEPVKKVSRDYQAFRSTIADFAVGTFSGVTVLKSLLAEKVISRKFKRVSDRFMELGKRQATVSLLSSVVPDLASKMSSVGTLVATGWLAMAGKVSLGQGIALMQLASQVIPSFISVPVRWAGLQPGIVAWERLTKALEMPQEDDLGDVAPSVSADARACRALAAGVAAGAAETSEMAEAAAEAVVADAGEMVETAKAAGSAVLADPAVSPPVVEFESVSFSYKPGIPVLSDVSLVIDDAQRAALIGPSGAGKTTVFKLLLGMYRADSGSIRVKGRDISTLRLAELRGSMALVPQEPWIFPGTVAENIALGKPGATRDEVLGAAVAANAHEFISALPEGYDTLLTERGGNLSGGERQRICLARAFLKDAPVLLLDEPTSSVDSESERLIGEALHRLGKGRTVLTISHTGRMLENCDAVFSLENGRLNR